MRTSHVLLLWMPLAACSPASAQPTPFQRGMDLLQRGEYEGALQQLKAASRSRPKDGSIHNFIGITETKLGRLDEADAEYRTAARLDRDLPGPEKNLGFNYLSTGHYALAEEPLKAALRLDASDPSVHYYLVILYLSTNRQSEAMEHIEPAQNLLSKDVPTGLLAIKACLERHGTEQALKLIRGFERAGSLSVAQEYELATILSERQMYGEAVPRFEKIATMQPAVWQNKYNLAIAYLKAGQPADACPLLERLAAQRPGDANVLGMLGSSYDQRAQPVQALAAYRRAVLADPENPDRYLDGTRILVDLNRFEEAAVLLREGIARVPDSYPLTIRMGAIQMMQGDPVKAREEFSAAIREHPEIALGYVALAQTYMKQGNDAKALNVLVDGRGKVARDFALEYVLGLVSFEAGQQAQALEALKNAEDLGPGVVEPHFQLGMLYMQMSEWTKARTEFESVLRLDPHHAATFYQLSRTYQRTGNVEKAQQMAKEASLLTRTQREGSIRSEQLRLGVPTQP